MTTVLEDIAIKYHAPEYVEQRIEDWEKRLADLYSMIQSWLPNGWEAINGEYVVMHEKIMKSAGVEQRKIPTLKVFNQTGNEIIFEPRGLWVIGANGRVDFEYKGELYYIYDSADNFQQPEWKVVNPMYWQQRDLLNKEWMHHLLS